MYIYKRVADSAVKMMDFEQILEELNILLDDMNVLFIFSNIDHFIRSKDKDQMHQMLFSLLSKDSKLKIMLTSSYRLGELGNYNEYTVEV